MGRDVRRARGTFLLSVTAAFAVDFDRALAFGVVFFEATFFGAAFFTAAFFTVAFFTGAFFGAEAARSFPGAAFVVADFWAVAFVAMVFRVLVFLVATLRDVGFLAVVAFLPAAVLRVLAFFEPAPPFAAGLLVVFFAFFPVADFRAVAFFANVLSTFPAAPGYPSRFAY